MKKLIMLSVFALGTITASASNDFFKNYYAEKTDQIQPVTTRSNYVVKIYRSVYPNVSITPYRTENIDCATEQELSYALFVIDESFLNPPPGVAWRKTVTKLGTCFGPIVFP